MKPLELIEAEDLVSRYYAGRTIYGGDSHNHFLRWLYESGHIVADVVIERSKKLADIIDLVTEEMDDEQLHPIS